MRILSNIDQYEALCSINYINHLFYFALPLEPSMTPWVLLGEWCFYNDLRNVILENEKMLQDEKQMEVNEAGRSSHLSAVNTNKVRPWIRLYARIIDIGFFSFLIGFFWGFFSPSTIPNNGFVLGMIVLFLWVFFEPILLSFWGTTLGKSLLQIQLRDEEEKKLSFTVALQRSFLVWFKGLAIGFPVIYLFTLVSAYNDLIYKGITSWDNKLHLKVSHQRIGFFRALVAAVIIGVLFTIKFIYSYSIAQHFLNP